MYPHVKKIKGADKMIKKLIKSLMMSKDKG